MSSQSLPKNIHSCKIRGHDQSSQLCLAYTVWSVNFVFSKISYVLIRIWWGPDDRMRWAHLSKHSSFCDMRCFLVCDVIFRDWMQNSQHNENFHCERVVCSANHLTFVIIERPHGMWVCDVLGILPCVEQPHFLPGFWYFSRSPKIPPSMFAWVLWVAVWCLHQKRCHLNIIWSMWLN